MKTPITHRAVTPGLIEAAETGDKAAIERTLHHCDAWLKTGEPLPVELRAWLHKRAAMIVCDAAVIESGSSL